MASSRIKGITIELGGDTTKLDKALSSVNKSIRSTQEQLRDVNKLLKLDPGNTELVAQKQKLLTEQIGNTKEKLNQLQEAAKSANEALASGKISQSQYDAIQREIVDTELELQNLQEELKDTNKSWEKWGEVAQKAGKVAKVAAKACAAAIVAAGTAIAGIVKESVEAYAEYEQLVGGVETLFKDSADTVMDYALNAYKTAGLSANAYMETVTSFSASLLQSLGGDTAEAAKIADMAITDMSDNANKMGTDMSMIQSAYQGFAKQNYTMLDNLKLGYGGTKSEMERLLKDATALTGIDYDINNLNDVYEAIHAIQTNLGITGTTAKEASTTIQGSVSAMKSSYENFLVALTDKNADLSKSVSNLIESAKTVLKNLLPVIQTALTSVVSAIKELAPEIIAILPGLVEEILPPLLEAAMALLDALVEVAPDIILTITTTILEYLPELITCAITMMTALITGLTDMIPDLIPVALDAVLQLVSALLDNIPLLLVAAGKIIGGLITGIIQNFPKIVTTAGKIIAKIASVFKPSTALKWGADLIAGLIDGIKSKLGGVGEAAASIAEKISNFIHFSRPDEGPLRDYETFMPDMINGMVLSINKNKYKLGDAMNGLASEMVPSPNSGINGSLNNITSLLSQGNVIVLDTGELVGATAKSYNAEFGKLARLEAMR